MHYKAWQGLMSERGVSDIIGCYNGRFFACEIKVGKGQLSDSQKRFLQRVQNAGGIAIVARSCEDVVKVLGFERELWPLFNEGL